MSSISYLIIIVNLLLILLLFLINCATSLYLCFIAHPIAAYCLSMASCELAWLLRLSVCSGLDLYSCSSSTLLSCSYEGHSNRKWRSSSTPRKQSLHIRSCRCRARPLRVVTSSTSCRSYHLSASLPRLFAPTYQSRLVIC